MQTADQFLYFLMYSETHNAVEQKDVFQTQFMILDSPLNMKYIN